MATRTVFQRETLGVVLLLTFLVGSTFATDQKPNLVLILFDDHGYADVGFHGSPDITTPALDVLAKNGTVFRSAYVAHRDAMD
ncbi:MAG: sulfatase-like hydrolase/transferase [Rubripirellula sp.]